MLITVLVLLAVATVPLSGGRYRGLAAIPWRLTWLLPLVLGVQIVLLQTPVVPERLAPGVHIASYLLAAVFVAVNLRQVPGLWLLGLGAFGNGLAIAANGGTMPASPEALSSAGLTDGAGFSNSAAVADANLAWLGDALAVPASWPLANVFSIGDVLIVMGAAYVAHSAGLRARAHPRTAGTSPSTRSGSSRRSAACTESGVSTPT